SDYNGNTAAYGPTLDSYDEENRLMKATQAPIGAVLGRYQYDAFWRRVSRIDNFGVQTFYYYDGWRTIEEQSSAGITQATYVFGNYLDEALTMDRVSEPGPFYYHQNTLWSVFALTDPTGKGVEGYSYDAYGYQTVIEPGPDGILDFGADDVFLPGGKSFYDNPFLFTGQRYDPEIGLLYYKYRYDSSFFGRFMSRDPEDYGAGDWNLYEYVKGRPTRAVDPIGLCWCPEDRGPSRCPPPTPDNPPLPAPDQEFWVGHGQQPLLLVYESHFYAKCTISRWSTELEDPQEECMYTCTWSPRKTDTIT